MSGPALDQPAWLWLSPLALCLLWRWWPLTHRHPALALLAGAAARGDRALRALAALAWLALLLAVAGLHWPPRAVPAVGTGAHVVVALDRSRSMDQAFASGLRRLEHTQQVKVAPKVQVARQLLARFVDSRPRDHLGMVVFSTHPIPVAPLSPRQDMLRAAIAAAGLGRGLGDTNVGEGLREALRLFEGQPFNGSRIVLLVSDGAALLDRETRRELRELLAQHRVALYWLYIRSANGPDIFAVDDSDTPEWRLHHFFSDLDTPYRGYSAEDPGALAEALDAISQLHALPLEYRRWAPRRELGGPIYALVAVLLSLLALVDGALWRGCVDARG